MSYQACLTSATKALEADERGQVDLAIEAYKKAVEQMMLWSHKETNTDKKAALKKNMTRCLDRAEELQGKETVAKAKTLADKAGQLEKDKKYNEAKACYIKAAEILFEYKKTQRQKDVQLAIKLQIDSHMKSAELLTLLSAAPIPKHTPEGEYKPAPPTPQMSIANLKKPEQGQAAHLQQNNLSAEEYAFLKNEGSLVCGSRLPMWDDREQGYPSVHPLTSPTVFTDPAAPKLSQKQVEHGAVWMRPTEFLPKGVPPCIVSAKVDPLSISQSVVGNCSYVCSLIVAAAFEQRFPTAKLISSAMFPQDASGRPVPNPSGKHAVKLLVNGIVRMVIIDDRVVASKGKGWVGGPMGGHAIDVQGHSPLSGHCTSGDLWVALYEKAFLKVFGASYEFGGSSSCSDLYHLCGWIPESMDMDESFNKQDEWKRLSTAHHKGQVMTTMGTAPKGKMPEIWREKLGLIAGHAYSVLDYKEVNGLKLLKMMNPWQQHRWTGRYSHKDNVNWTPALQKVLQYDKRQEDNGVFWIDWNDATKFFERINLSWMPHTFPYRFAQHLNWKNNISENHHYFRCPQYSLTVEASAATSVWVLLCRHILAKAEEEHPFITIHVYNTTGLPPVRIATPYMLGEGRLLHNGVYKNASMKLHRLEIPAGHTSYTVIVSSLSTAPFPHTLTVYSPLKTIQIKKVPEKPYPHAKEVKGAWTSESAGGRAGLPTWKKNPQYRVVVKEPARIIATLEIAKEMSVGMSMSCVGKETLVAQGTHWQGRLESIQQIKYRNGNYGMAMACLDTMCPPDENEQPKGELVPPGVYTIVPCTYEGGLEAPFKLTVYSNIASCAASLVPIGEEGAGMKYKELRGEWTEGVKTVTFKIHSFSQITCRLIATSTQHHISATLALNDVKAAPCSLSEYLLPLTAFPHPVSSSSPATLTATVHGTQPGSFVIRCYTNTDLQLR